MSTVVNLGLGPLGEAALEYAHRGWHVFPLHQNGHVDKEGQPDDKAPATRHGFKDASVDERQIRTWWRDNPDANIGIACGKSNLVVVDIDRKKGVDGFASLRVALGTLPRTRTTQTP